MKRIIISLFTIICLSILVGLPIYHFGGFGECDGYGYHTFKKGDIVYSKISGKKYIIVGYLYNDSYYVNNNIKDCDIANICEITKKK